MTSTCDIEKRFVVIARRWEAKSGVRVRLARIFGERWAYVAGKVGTELGSVKRVRLNADWGLLFIGEAEACLEEEIISTVKEGLFDERPEKK